MRWRIDYAPFADIICETVSALTVGTDYGLSPGKDGRCACIFCNGDRKDTLRLYSGNRGFYCFRCHTGGTVVSLYRQITGSTFPQAVKDLNEQYGLNLPLDGADRNAIDQAKRRAEERRRQQAKKEARNKRLLTALWDASDAVAECDRVIKELAPKDPSEPWKQRFIIALRYVDELREYRDWLFDELYRKF